MIVNKIRIVLNRIVKKTYWYNNIVFADCRKFWEHNIFGLDLINLGSSSAKAAFCYTQFSELKTANWAMAPQSLVGDYEILRNYSCYLRKGATVLIPICPFSCLGGSNDDFPDKYYTILNIASMPHASFRRQQQQNQIMRKPWQYYPLSQLFRIRHKTKKTYDDSHYEKDALSRLEGWRKEFSIFDFSYPLSMVNEDAYRDGIQILNNMVDYCFEHEFNPVFVMPPVHESLHSRFDSSMKQLFIDSFIKEASNKGILFLNYFNDNRFKTDMFLDSFLLNSKGAACFTKIVLSDLKLI